MQDLVQYLGVDGLPAFQFYLDAVRSLVRLIEEDYDFRVKRLELQLRDRVELEDNSADWSEWVRTIVETYRAVDRQCPPGTAFGDLLMVQASLVSYGDPDGRLGRLAGEIVAKLSGNVPEEWGVSPQRLVRSLAPLRVIRSASEEDRLRAAERLAAWMGAVIHKVRCPWVTPALNQLARLHGGSPDQELRALIRARVFEAVEVAGQYTLAQEENARRALRARVAAMVTIDLLGPGWRHEIREMPPNVAWAGLSPHVQAETRLLVERRLAAAGLTHREAEVFALVAAREGDHGAVAAAAHELGIHPSTARVLLGRARKKIAAADQ